MLCNVLVCLAVWMAFAGRSVVDKAVAIVFPISAFVAAGFEHSIANMYFIPMGLLLKATGSEFPGAEQDHMDASAGQSAPGDTREPRWWKRIRCADLPLDLSERPWLRKGQHLTIDRANHARGD